MLKEFDVLTPLDLILKYPDLLMRRDFIVDAFSESVLQTEAEVKERYTGKIIIEGKVIKVIIDDEVQPLSAGKAPFLAFEDKIKVPEGVVVNAKGSITTTIGRLLINHYLLSIPFGDVIPYINESWNNKAVEKLIIDALLLDKITTDSVYLYINSLNQLVTYSDFCVPAITSKAITVDPKVVALRKKLLTQYKDQLDDPMIMMKIEKELIALDKETLKGDISNDFMISGKNYDNHRKRMFLGIGMVGTFGEEGNGHNFIKGDLDSGWDLNDVDKLSNDIRDGSYSRAQSTAIGGSISKSLGRTYQDSRVVMDDCKSKLTLSIHLTTTNKDDYLFRTIITGASTVLLTPENISKYINKTVKLRSPLTCKAKTGYCYTCLDYRFKKLEVESLNVQIIGIGSTILSDSMAKMHVSTVSAYELDSIDQFCQ